MSDFRCKIDQFDYVSWDEYHKNFELLNALPKRKEDIQIDHDIPSLLFLLLHIKADNSLHDMIEEFHGYISMPYINSEGEEDIESLIRKFLLYRCDKVFNLLKEKEDSPTRKLFFEYVSNSYKYYLTSKINYTPISIYPSSFNITTDEDGKIESATYIDEPYHVKESPEINKVVSKSDVQSGPSAVVLYELVKFGVIREMDNPMILSGWYVLSGYTGVKNYLNIDAADRSNEFMKVLSKLRKKHLKEAKELLLKMVSDIENNLNNNPNKIQR